MEFSVKEQNKKERKPNIPFPYDAAMSPHAVPLLIQMYFYSN
jgi:hypothetical protein